MKTFDYESAWDQLAKPAYEALPQTVRDLVARVAVEAADLHQLPDCSMPWPASGELRAAFELIDTDLLARAAHVVYMAGHWMPSGRALDLPGRQIGSSWKFSHYADQVLRGRLGLGESGDYRHGNGFHLAVVEGALRACYSSRDMWTWVEVGPATSETARCVRSLPLFRFEQIRPSQRADRDSAAYEQFEAMRNGKSPLWPADWLPWMALDSFMVDESELAIRRRPPFDPVAERANLVKAHQAKLTKLADELNGQLWLVDRGFSIENVIYYSHTKRFCFGWRTPLSAKAISDWLDVLVEFPYDYDIKGYTPKGADAK